MVIEQALHELIVIGTEFSVSRLLPCAAPKFDPDTTTWLPTAPVVAESPVMIGASADAELTETLSKLTDTKLVGVPATANPT